MVRWRTLIREHSGHQSLDCRSCALTNFSRTHWPWQIKWGLETPHPHRDFCPSQDWVLGSHQVDYCEPGTACIAHRVEAIRIQHHCFTLFHIVSHCFTCFSNFSNFPGCLETIGLQTAPRSPHRLFILPERPTILQTQGVCSRLRSRSKRDSQNGLW